MGSTLSATRGLHHEYFIKSVMLFSLGFVIAVTCFLGNSRVNFLRGGTDMESQMYASTDNPFTAGDGEIIGVSIKSPVKVINNGRLASLVQAAKEHPRKRKMIDLTRDPATNGLQVLLNTWTEGSYSPVHRHLEFSETFTILDGALAFFTFTEAGNPTCYVLDAARSQDRVVVVEAGQYHAMTAAPRDLGYEGYAVVFENSGHFYEKTKQTKALAPFSKVVNGGLDGDPEYFRSLLGNCPLRRVPTNV